MRKLSDLTEKEQQDIQQVTEFEGNKLVGYYANSTTIGKTTKFGLCKDCVNLDAVFFEFGKSIAVCNRFKFRLNENDKVVDCMSYYARNVMMLDEMNTLATIIDLNKKDKIGF